jgi:sec-independent protein translocase protein TatA
VQFRPLIAGSPRVDCGDPLPSKESKMIEGLFQPMHLLLVFGIALLVLGPRKLPELGKGIGDGIRGFRSAMKDDREHVAKKEGLPHDSGRQAE